METVVTLLKSIDTWTIAGSLAAVVCAIFAYFAIPRRPTAARRRREEIADLLRAIEVQTDELISCFRDESTALNSYGSRQTPGWKPSEKEFNEALAKTRVECVQLRAVLARAAHQPDKEQFGSIQVLIEGVAEKADMLIKGRCLDTDLATAVSKLRDKRLSLMA